MLRRWQPWLSACLLSAGAALAAPQAGVTPGEVAELNAAIARANPLSGAGRFDACVAELAPVRDIAWRYLAPDNDWPFAQLRCALMRTLTLGPGVPLADIQALLDPWRDRLRPPAAALPHAEIAFANGYWLYLWANGFRERGEAAITEALTERLQRATAVPPDTAAVDDLLFIARAWNGHWEMHEQVKGFHELFRQQLGESHPVTLRALRDIAYNERFLGRPELALEHIQQAAALAARDHPEDPELIAGMRSERAACLAGVGRLADALADALAVRDFNIKRDPPLPINLVRSNYNLAEIALDMGDYRAAIEYADQSIAYARHYGESLLLTESLVPAATREVARVLLGEPGAAQALKAAVAATDGEMHIGSQAFALVEAAARDGDPALLKWSVNFMREHISLFRLPFHADRALLPLMQAWQQGGMDLRPADVRPQLEQALAGSLTGRSLANEALVQFNLARHLANAQPDEAVWLYKRGANALQQLRNGLPSGDAQLHRAWLSSHERDLRDLIGLLIDRGRLAEAEQAVRALRDEELYEYSRRARRSGTVQPLSYTPGEADNNVGISALAQRVADAARAADERADAARKFGDKRDYRDPQADADLKAFGAEVHELLAPAPSRSAARTTLRGASSRPLPAGAVRLTYFVRETSLDIVLQRGQAFRRVSVPVTRLELNRCIQAMRVAMLSPQTNPLPPAQALYRLLIAPVDRWLPHDPATRLQIAPDATLRYVPFAALHDGRRYAAQRFVLATELFGSAEAAAAPNSARVHGLVAFGRSLGDAEHAPLPGVERELAAVAAHHGEVRLNDRFDEASLTAALKAAPAVVHLASHFTLDPQGDDKSYLLLGDARPLSLAALRRLPWTGVRLAVLSACDSAVAVDAGGGGEGRELIGFAAALREAGVRNVVASLWQVSDGATADWMREFYARMPTGRGAALAPVPLAHTQRAWLRRHAPRTALGAALRHPHYWAAFSWFGEP